MDVFPTSNTRGRLYGSVLEIVGNTPLEQAMNANYERLGPPRFDEADKAFAREIQKTLTAEEIDATYRRAGIPPIPGEALCERIVPLDAPEPKSFGSTDVGTVSWVVPTVQARGETAAVETLNADAADDPAIWRNPADPARSLIVATDKRAGLHVYGLDGTDRSFVPAGRVNNVDLRDSGKAGIIVAASAGMSSGRSASGLVASGNTASR